MGTPMQYIPPVPPAPKKSLGKTVLLTIVATVSILAVIGTLIDENEPAANPVTVDTSLTTDSDMTLLRDAWNTAITASERADICDYYNTPPVGTTPEMVRIFADSAAVPYDEADRLLNALLAEEC